MNDKRCSASGRQVFTLAPLAAAALLALADPAFAQTPAAKADEDNTQRIVITANKRAQAQREVAGTVTVLQGSELERRGARDQEDSLTLAPGVQFNKGDIASNTITIRGIGTNTTNESGGAQQAPTGQYLEDVPLASPTSKGIIQDPVTWDLDRVEVLRGPQGVLFGSGSLGGAVRYLFAKPRFGDFEASVRADYTKAAGGSDSFSVFGMLNAPLSGTAALRVVAFDRRDPGYIDNLGTGTKDANEVHQRGGRVLVSLKPTKGLSATLVASQQKTEQGDTFSVSPDPNQLVHTAPNNSFRSVTADFYSVTVDAELGFGTLTSITGHVVNKSRQLIDDTELFGSVGLALPQVIRPANGKTRATSQELRLSSNPGSAVSWLVGAFYQSSKGDSTAKQIEPSGAFGLTDLVDLVASNGGTEAAVFADTEFTIGGGWSAGVGARYYRTTSEQFQDGTIFGAPARIDAPDGKDNGVTPKLTLKYRFGENLLYAVAAKGYRYGGVNGTAPFKAFQSDSLWSYETGIRLAPAPGLTVDLAAFLLDWKEAQFTYFVLNGRLPESGIDNVGKARSTGLETSIRWKPSRALDLGLTLAYIDAKTKSPTVIPSGGPTSVTAPAGSRLPGTPKLQGSFDAATRFAGPAGSEGRASLTYKHVGERVMFLGGNKPAEAFDTVDLGLSFTRGSFTLATGVSNVTDERGVMSITGAPAGVGAFAQYFVQRPRTYSVSLRYDM